MKRLLEFFDKHRWQQLDSSLSSAFERVRQDCRNLYGWIEYLRDRDLVREEKQEMVSRELGAHEERISALKEEVHFLRQEMARLAFEVGENIPKISPNPDQVRTKSGLKSEPEPRRENSRRIIAISRPVKKSYVMQQISNLAAKGSYSTKQIESIIVREKALCGRTAFYDYLKELRISGYLKNSGKNLQNAVVSDED